MDAYATDGKLKQSGLVILSRNPGRLEAVNRLAGTLTDEVWES